MCKLHPVVLNEDLRYFHQHHIPRKAAIVPPVKLQRRHGIGTACIVYFHNQEIVAISQQRSYFEVERCKPAFVLAQLFAIEVNGGAIVSRAKIGENPRSRVLMVAELAPVPDRPFIEHQLLALRVPVSRDVEHRRRIETVFNAITLILRLLISEESRLAVVKWVHDRSPRTAEVHRRSGRNIRNQSGWSRSGVSPSRQEQQQ